MVDVVVTTKPVDTEHLEDSTAALLGRHRDTVTMH